MISGIVHFFRRRNSVSHKKAWLLSGLWVYASRVRQWASVAVIAACCIYLMSSAANSATETGVTETAPAFVDRSAAMADEITALRKIVAACLGEKEGALIVGGEYFLCRAASIGERAR